MPSSSCTPSSTPSSAPLSTPPSSPSSCVSATTSAKAGKTKKGATSMSLPSSNDPGFSTLRLSVVPTLKGASKFAIDVPIDATHQDILRLVRKKDPGANFLMATLCFAATDSYEESWKLVNEKKAKRFMTILKNDEAHGYLTAKMF